MTFMEAYLRGGLDGLLIGCRPGSGQRQRACLGWLSGAKSGKLGRSFRQKGETRPGGFSLAATPPGLKVWACAKLIKIDGKRLSFTVEAYDEKEKIGEGTHERYIIDLDKFLQRTNNKK